MDSQLNAEIQEITQDLDRIIHEQAGERVFERLHELRQHYRFPKPVGTKGKLRPGSWHIQRLSVRDAYQVAHALSLFFQVVNLCEERARVRHLNAATTPAMSLRKLFHDLKESGVTAAQLQRCLDELEIQPVLTAHPTEAKRRAVMNQLRRLDEHWD
jgi:phosphoenolpyruvate carboxylase